MVGYVTKFWASIRVEIDTPYPVNYTSLFELGPYG